MSNKLPQIRLQMCKSVATSIYNVHPDLYLQFLREELNDLGSKGYRLVDGQGRPLDNIDVQPLPPQQPPHQLPAPPPDVRQEAPQEVVAGKQPIITREEMEMEEVEMEEAQDQPVVREEEGIATQEEQAIAQDQPVPEEEAMEEEQALVPKRKTPGSSYRFTEPASKKPKKKQDEEMKLTKLKRTLANSKEQGRYNYEVVGEVLPGQQITLGIQNVEHVQGDTQEQHQIRVLVANYMEYKSKERRCKAYRLYCCLLAYRRLRASGETKTAYLLPFHNTPLHRNLQEMLTIGFKLQTITEWIDDDEVDVWRLKETLDINFFSTTLTMIEHVFQ